MTNMKYIRYFFLFFMILSSTISLANRKKKNIIAKPKTQPAVSVNKLYESMLQSTAKVMFIDSVVVDKEQFLQAIPLPSDLGQIKFRPNSSYLLEYQNELDDRKFIADGDTAITLLKTQTATGKSWSLAEKLPGLDNKEYLLQNYPFLASDGITLYFSADGPSSMGGRDIFMTSFDSDKGIWLQPQNYGLPFNSPANDYLLVIDDLDSLGWLVTDRRQPEGKVCVYTFVPTSVRQNFEVDGLSNAMLKSYADIKSIKDTWKFGNRQTAMLRLKNIRTKIRKQQNKNNINFIINDKQIIRSIDDFKSDESRKLYKQLVEIKQIIIEEEHQLQKQRIQYESDSSMREKLYPIIIKEEQLIQKQKLEQIAIEKRIRNIENEYK
ncbi:MAG: hypothetical protein HXL35_06085 [Prevotellaceae bacterium]|nr:hypothetical protein [Prevotellaceae bacterium]